MTSGLPAISELRRLASPAAAPQALAWHGGILWTGSRDDCRLYGLDAEAWTVVEETATPGIPWAAVPARNALYFTSGEDAADDRYLRRYEVGRGFDDSYRVPVPEFTGSYLSFDGENLYLSQWYKHRLIRLDFAGNVLRTIALGAEISGHVFVDGRLYVLRGTEQDGERWHVARLDPRQESPDIEELARVPFACRSLAFDGSRFWTNHRAANETVSFALPF
jgi:hypothetical protein